MYLDKYKIEGTTNLDSNGCFHNENTYPNFQEDIDYVIYWVNKYFE